MAIARAWQAAITDLGSLLDRAEEYHRLHSLADQIMVALHDESMDRTAVRAAGAALGALYYRQPEALRRTQELLSEQLLAGIDEEHKIAIQPRLGAVLAEFSAGVFQQAQETILAEQEAIRNALLLQQRQAEAARRESAARFQAIFEHAPLGIALADTDGGLIETNPAMQRLLGYRRSELEGRLFKEFANADDLKADRYLFDELINGQRDFYEAEERYYRPDGSVVWGHMAVSVVRDGAGHPPFLLAIGENITERKRTEAELARQLHAAETARGETRAILDATGEAMLLIAPDGRILTANRQCEAFFGLGQRSLVGQTVAAVRPAFQRIFDGPAAVDALLAHLGEGDGRFQEDLVQQWPERRELEVSSTPVLSADGRPLGRLFAFRDVTRERAVDRMKSEFVALVSHELRTPLTSIKGYVDLLVAGEVGELGAEQQEFLAIVSNNADRLVALIGNLLDISRMESGKVEIIRAPVDLGRLLAASAATFRPQVEQKRQHLTLEVEEALPPVSGDADRVQQIVTNLVSNAHKYTPVGGTIAVTARRDGAMVRVAVQDTGTGMSAEEQAQLFTRFFRGKGRVVQDAGGTGLGLVIVRSLVDLHGGELQVTSRPEHGTTISFTLPVDPDAVAPPVATQPAPKGGLVLVVDDEPDLAQLFGRYLERAGYDVRLAGSASEALRSARAERPDLIILDLLLPETDGFTALARLKRDPATTSIPVLLLSILEDDGRGRRLGAVDHLTKPVQEPTLLAHVAAALARA